jgi:uncharacterized protein
MRLIALMSVLFLFACGEKKNGFSVENIPDPRQQGVYVSNPDHILSETTVASLNVLMEGLDKEGTAYVAIVVLKTIGDKVPKEVAHEIFKLWKPGDAAKNNGLLVLLVEDQHRIEFETGYGLEGDLPDVICFRIQQQKMVPLFKQNDYDAGMIQGMDAVAAVLRHAQVAETDINTVTEDDSSVDPIYDAPSRELPGDWTLFAYFFSFFPSTIIAGFFISKKGKNGKPFNSPPRLFTAGFFSGLWLYIFPFIAILAYIWLTDYNFYWWTLLGIFYLNWLTYLLYRITVININAGRLLSNERQQRYDAFNLAHRNFGAYAFIFPIPLFLYHKWNQNRMARIRNTPFSCEQCNTPMELINKKNKKQSLDEGQLTEEKIGSVNYDIWHCQSCNKEKAVGYESIYTKATECSKCHYKTLRETKKVVIKRPTYSSKGSGLQHYECKHCDHIEKTPYVIAKLTSSSSSSSGSSSGSSSSSSSGSSSGGSSGGGGAGSSW